MLNYNQIKVPLVIKIYFLLLKNKRFLVLKNKNSIIFMTISIPAGIYIKKLNQFLILYNTDKKYNIEFYGFFTYLNNFILNYQLVSKKTLILRGLGLKVFLKESHLNFKLGYSNEKTISIDSITDTLFSIGKKSISIFSYDKVFLGNFIEKIYRLKKANCYKGRGLYYKDKYQLIKNIKKT